MTHGELIRDYERRLQDAKRFGTHAPLDKAISAFLDDLRALDGLAPPAALMDTAQAAQILNISPKTVRKWCMKGRFPGARQTNGQRGEWRIPSSDVFAEAGNPPPKRPRSPKLWIPEGRTT